MYPIGCSGLKHRAVRLLQVLGISACLGWAVLPAWGSPDPAKETAGQVASERHLYHPGEILVKFKPVFTTATQGGLKNQIGVQVSTRAEALSGVHAFFKTQPVGMERFGWQRVQLPEGKSVAQALSEFVGNAAVEAAEPNYLRHVHDAISTTYAAYAAPNDLLYQAEVLWWFNRIHADQAFSQANYFTAGPVVVAVVDTGVDLTHTDLSSRLIPGYNAITPTSPPQDDDGHGTHTAGLVAAAGNNSQGTLGAAFSDKVVVMPVKVLDYQGNGTSANIAAGIQWAADHGARVISMSFGGSNNSSLESSACDYAYAHGCVLVASAGNNSLNLITNPVYPALYNHVICVAATNSQDYATYYSNYGLGKITLSAPGGYDQNVSGNVTTRGNDGGVYSTILGSAFGPKSGTSMAAPQVSAAAALLLLQNPLRTQSEVLALLTSHCENPQAQPASWVGAGRINVAASLSDFQTPTISPTATSSPTITPTATITQTATVSPTATISPSITPTPTITQTATISPTSTCTPTMTPTATPSATYTPLVLSAGELLVYPQPGRDHVRLAFRLAGFGRLTAEVYNVRGERVLTLSETPYCNGGVAYADVSTSRLAAGIYFLLVRVADENGERRLSKRMAIIR
ncbi:MAG: S8 family serine peptidase [Candidatus Firestonebacteria bacterium]|nr:S8 family serine peptidase [Candidatus Firestonebacteria bacterium]